MCAQIAAEMINLIWKSTAKWQVLRTILWHVMQQKCWAMKLRFT